MQASKLDCNSDVGRLYTSYHFASYYISKLISFLRKTLHDELMRKVLIYFQIKIEHLKYGRDFDLSFLFIYKMHKNVQSHKETTF